MIFLTCYLDSRNYQIFILQNLQCDDLFKFKKLNTINYSFISTQYFTYYAVKITQPNGNILTLYYL